MGLIDRAAVGWLTKLGICLKGEGWIRAGDLRCRNSDRVGAELKVDEANIERTALSDSDGEVSILTARSTLNAPVRIRSGPRHLKRGSAISREADPTVRGNDYRFSII